MAKKGKSIEKLRSEYNAAKNAYHKLGKELGKATKKRPRKK